jgi:hypothetical protein
MLIETEKLRSESEVPLRVSHESCRIVLFGLPTFVGTEALVLITTLLASDHVCVFSFGVTSYRELAVEYETGKGAPDHAQAPIVYVREAKYFRGEDILPLPEVRQNVDCLIIPVCQVALARSKADAFAIQVQSIPCIGRDMYEGINGWLLQDCKSLAKEDKLTFSCCIVKAWNPNPFRFAREKRRVCR